MSGISSLSQLIHSLSKAEKKSFSQYAALQTSQKSYLSLYEVIQKTDFKDIESEFKRENPDSDFHATAQYLWTTVIKISLSMRAEQQDEEELLHGILEIKLLLRKGLTDEAFRSITKYKALAIKAEKFDYCFLIEKLELQHQNLHHFEDVLDEEHLVTLQTHLRCHIQLELNLTDHSSLYELLYYRYLQKGNILSDKDKEHLNDLVVTEMNLSGNQRFESFDLNRNHLLFQSVYFMMTGDHRSSLATFFELNTLFERNAHLWQDSPNVYINHLCGILNNLYNANQAAGMDFFIGKLKTLALKSHPLIIDQAICVAEIKKAILNTEFEQANSIIDIDFIHLFLHSDALAATDQAELHLFAALITFHSMKYRKAAGLLRKIIYLEPIKNSWLWKMVKWLNLLINIELNEFDYLIGEVSSVERLLKKRGVFYPTDKILIHYMKRYPMCMNKRAKVLLAKECKKDLDALEKNLYEMQFLNTMKIEDWLAQKQI
jgi:hypothetical protein